MPGVVVTGVTVVVVTVVVVTVGVVTVVVVTVVMMAVMTVMAMTAAMPATMPAAVTAGRRVARGGEGRNRQHNGSSSGSEDRTLHWTSPGLIQSDHRPGVCPVSALKRPEVM